MAQSSKVVKAYYRSKLPVKKSNSLGLMFISSSKFYELLASYLGETMGLDSWIQRTLGNYSAKRRLDFVVTKSSGRKEILLELDFAAQVALDNGMKKLSHYLIKRNEV